MSSLQPEQASVLLQYLLPTLKQEQRTTSNVLRAVPADQGNYRPDAVSMTADELAWHIASADLVFLQPAGLGQFDLESVKRPDNVKTPAEIADWYDQKYAEAYAKLSQLSPEQLSKVVDFRGAFQMPAVSYLDFGLRHSIHHRGQLSSYLRPMGSKVPSIYGSSYDDKQAKKAAEAAAN